MANKIEIPPNKGYREANFRGVMHSHIVLDMAAAFQDFTTSGTYSLGVA